MQQVIQKFSEIKRICEDEVDPTKNVKYKIEQFFKMGRIEFKQHPETFEWRYE
jgi:hypothetical protein